MNYLKYVIYYIKEEKYDLRVLYVLSTDIV